MNHLKPFEILEAIMNGAVVKASMPLKKMIIFGLFAGAYIAFAGAGANMAAFNLLASPETFGLGKILSGTIFTAGLMLVVLGGAELFTGNTTMVAAAMDRRITAAAMLKNWIIVYICNFIGSVLIAFMVYYSGGLNAGEGMLGAVTVKIAAGKVNMDFGAALVSGIMCNWLVCMAVWLSTGAQTTVGKIFSIFFPIWLFVTAGFEHSVANMFFIPAGIMAALEASKNHEVILVDGNEKIGKKLFITGKGRCNVTNAKDISEFFDYIPGNPHFLYSALYTYTNNDVINFIEENGTKLKVERGGRMFPFLLSSAVWPRQKRGTDGGAQEMLNLALRCVRMEA